MCGVGSTNHAHPNNTDINNTDIDTTSCRRAVGPVGREILQQTGINAVVSEDPNRFLLPPHIVAERDKIWGWGRARVI